MPALRGKRASLLCRQGAEAYFTAQTRKKRVSSGAGKMTGKAS
jgi:hypothetical protein